MSKVYIGIGHGGTDPGACANNLRESDLNLALGILVQAELQRCGFDTKISRTSDVYFPNASKITDANNWAPDFVIDVHHNAGGGVGFEIFCSKNADGSEKVAQAISSEIDTIGRKNRGVKTNVQNGVDYFGIIRRTSAPAVLIEYGFIDNAADVKAITDRAQKLAWAQATAKGICTAAGVPYVPEIASTLYRVQVGAFKGEAAARDYVKAVQEMGLDAFLVAPEKDEFYRVQIGAFLNRPNAESFMSLVKKEGLDALIVTI